MLLTASITSGRCLANDGVNQRSSAGSTDGAMPRIAVCQSTGAHGELGIERAVVNGANERHAMHRRGKVERHALRDHRAHRKSYDARALDAEVTDQRDDLLRIVRERGIGARLGAAAVSEHVGNNDAMALLQRVGDRRPHCAGQPDAVEQDDRGTRSRIEVRGAGRVAKLLRERHYFLDAAARSASIASMSR